MIPVLLNTVLVFVGLMVVLRVTGKRELAQMSGFDVLMLLVIGDVIAEAVVSEDTSFTGAAVSVSVLTLLTVLLSWVTFRFDRTRPGLDSVPCVVVRDGEPDLMVMRRERITSDDLREAARTHGVRSIEDVELAILEPSGQFSFFTRTN